MNELFPEAREVATDDFVHCEQCGTSMKVEGRGGNTAADKAFRYRQWRCTKCGRRDHTKLRLDGPGGPMTMDDAATMRAMAKQASNEGDRDVLLKAASWIEDGLRPYLADHSG